MKPVHTRPQFSIATIFLAMTLVGISLAVVGYVPCLGFVLLFVGPPACLRAAVVGYQCHRAGISLSVGEKIEIIVQSVYAATVLAGILSGLAAFGFSFWCWTMPLDGSQEAK